MNIFSPLPTEMKEYYSLRWKILRKPLGLKSGTEKDDIEDKSIHRIVKIDNKIVGVGRLHFVKNDITQIRYMAVDDVFRGIGVGSLIVNEFILISNSENVSKIILNARQAVLNFYKKLDFHIVKEVHSLKNVRHFLMERILIDKDK
ncbi:MAG: hypothetical protein CMG00_04670 [Candidatus Marinimicrobia bacterium]|nr:hypothetical protein [Candidatus Neomarinimicrobiota bacterium]|tara:strand:- start:7742 stop:8179 length:438 start_codon:yes stop_codon:yes gene_type:complete